MAWLADIDYHQPEDKRAKAAEAIRQMGAQTLPFLLADLGDQRSNRVRYFETDKRTADERGNQATWAFNALGSIGKPAIRELVKMLEHNPGYVPGALAGIGRDALPELLNAFTHGSFWVRDNTAAYLANAIYSGKIQPEEASAALPRAISNLAYSDTNAMFRNNTRNRAAGLLGALKLAPEITVPALTQGLADTNPTVASTCAWSLLGFGPEAKSAIPMLIKAAESTNAQVNSASRRALEQIEKAQ